MQQAGNGDSHGPPPDQGAPNGVTASRGGEVDIHPGYRVGTWAFLGAAFVGVLLLFSIRCAQGPQTSRDYPSRSLPPEPRMVLLAPPPMDDDYFPCSDCHEDEPTDRTVRELEDEHEDLELTHGETWCLDCHDTDQRDELHLADERRVPFEESWRLCTQCHGSKLADWRAGVHGKRSGHWWGPREYWNCVACHDPHAPAFTPLEPLPPPARPETITLATRPEQETVHEEP
jgi:hypothetical protein